MKTKSGVISDDEILKEFGDTHTSYTLLEKRELLEKGVIDALVGYSSGHTLTEIMKNMKLINKNNAPLERGRYFIWNTYRP